VAYNGYWEINLASPTTNVYSGTFTAKAFSDIIDYTKLHLVKRGNFLTNWQLDGTHVVTTGSNALATLKRTGMSGFSQFAVGGESSVSLPINFSNIKAFQQGSAIKVEWNNLTESDMSAYSVERSADGRNFTAIGQVTARVNNGSKAEYSFTDAAPLSGVNYYRILATENTGSKKYSMIVKVDTKSGATDIVVYPNPVIGGQVSLQASGLPKGQYTVRIFNANGQQVQSQVINHTGGGTTQVITLPNAVKAGMYSLQLSGNDMKMIKSFIVN
jgi:hypothetical protein